MAGWEIRYLMSKSATTTRLTCATRFYPLRWHSERTDGSDYPAVVRTNLFIYVSLFVSALRKIFVYYKPKWIKVNLTETDLYCIRLNYPVRCWYTQLAKMTTPTQAGILQKSILRYMGFCLIDEIEYDLMTDYLNAFLPKPHYT